MTYTTLYFATGLEDTGSYAATAAFLTAMLLAAYLETKLYTGDHGAPLTHHTPVVLEGAGARLHSFRKKP